MKVTKLISQKRDPSRVNMYIDDEFFCGISLDSVAKFGLYVGYEIGGKELDKVLKNELLNRFTQRAVSYLSRSIHTQYQIRRYLKDLSLKKKDVWYKEIEKEELEKIFNTVLEKLEKYGYIDDSNYAEQFINSRIKNKPRGKQILISELISKGVSRDVAQEKVDLLVKDEYQVLKDVYEKKYKEDKLDRNDSKRIAFLSRKGFSWDLIERYINNESEE